jgi:hypothetical protein
MAEQGGCASVPGAGRARAAVHVAERSNCRRGGFVPHQPTRPHQAAAPGAARSHCRCCQCWIKPAALPRRRRRTRVCHQVRCFDAAELGGTTAELTSPRCCLSGRKGCWPCTKVPARASHSTHRRQPSPCPSSKAADGCFPPSWTSSGDRASLQCKPTVVSQAAQRIKSKEGMR